MNVKVDSAFIPPSRLPFEIVERKGLGHPDTLADGLAENAEIEYCNYCLREFGCVPHHNFDKLTLTGGMCKQVWGGGKFIEPVRLAFLGRGSKIFAGKSIPLAEIQESSAREYLSRILPALNISDPQQFICESLTSSRSTRHNWFTPESINDLPEYSQGGPYSNDTAAMISWYPLTECESLALHIEGWFYTENDGLPRPKFNEFGQDIKIMIARKDECISVTAAVPFMTQKFHSVDEYRERLEILRRELSEHISSSYPDSNIVLHVNWNAALGDMRIYLTTGGSCTDFGEEGAVGRGNKTHGIISSFRPNTMEAPHGKNSVYFAGKILGYLADVTAKEIYTETGKPCQIILQADMGAKLYEPSNVIISTEGKIDRNIIDNIISRNFIPGHKVTNRILASKHFIPRISI